MSSGERPTESSKYGPEVHIEESRPIESRSTMHVEVENIKRIRKPPSHLQDYLCYNGSLKDPSTHAPTLQNVSSAKIAEPKFYLETVRDANWREVMANEIETSELNNIWTMDLPPRCKPINCKWIYKVKYNAD